MKFLHSVDVKSTISKNGTNIDSIYEASFSKNSAFNKNFGTTSGTVAEGNHVHTGLMPGAHASTHVTGGNDVIPNAVANGNSGLLSGVDKGKIDKNFYTLGSVQPSDSTLWYKVIG